jgi:hypothetical protein
MWGIQIKRQLAVSTKYPLRIGPRMGAIKTGMPKREIMKPCWSLGVVRNKSATPKGINIPPASP